ncbi:hypothetical protein BN381_290172 [Candidatus Microthrix parvicella RN1]|uniref:Uncharacterized protein n=1 Tax=Candidatus Neomicrothrix parvicella RN1 TaxID=1229780 RepID=R4YZ02_9ACTN|nr:hypothetical protein BN381_290172 [Candidatus Microthrix parvicella RN1]
MSVDVINHPLSEILGAPHSTSRRPNPPPGANDSDAPPDAPDSQQSAACNPAPSTAPGIAQRTGPTAPQSGPC